MKTARIIAKGTIADVAATAATHGLYLVGVYKEKTAAGQVVVWGTVYAGEGKDWAVGKRIRDWFAGAPFNSEASAGSRFPPGTLLFFNDAE